MAGVSGGALAAETCRAGALGFVAAGHLQDVSQLEQEIDTFRNQAPKTAPLCVGFIGHSTFQSLEGWKRFEYVLEKHRPDVVQFFAPSFLLHPETKKSNIQLAHEYKAQVITQVGSVQEGLEAAEQGADCLIAQGVEAGGHGLRREVGNSSFSLAQNLLQLLVKQDVPILIAGGIVDGRGLAAALALGCDGAVLGTRLWASQEALGMKAFKQRLVETQYCDDVTRTTVFDQIQNAYSSTPWPEPFDSMGALRNAISEGWDGQHKELAAELAESSQLTKSYKQAQKEGNSDIAAVHCGEGVGNIDAVEPAFDIVTRVQEEAATIVCNMPKLVNGA